MNGASFHANRILIRLFEMVRVEQSDQEFLEKATAMLTDELELSLSRGGWIETIHASMQLWQAGTMTDQQLADDIRRIYQLSEGITMTAHSRASLSAIPPKDWP